MSKKAKKIIVTVLVILIIGITFLFTHVPSLPDKHGIVEAKLYLGTGENQPLVVAFGGGGGGNDWTRHYLKQKRDSLLNKGYSVLAIGYFKSKGTQNNLDRISLNAIADTILNRAKHPKIDASKIALMGGSKGGELVLNLASRYPQFKAVIAMSTSHVSFPALTIYANTSSWMYNNQEVNYTPAPLKTLGPALKGDLYTAHVMMLEDKAAAKDAQIPVEKINGAILILSGKNDDQWPATTMSNELVSRLENNGFAHPYEHIVLNGGHIAPLENFGLVYRFLDAQFK
ncbi:MAG: acyl-CoA thioester hydrolase/BAAT C-terminal domain-containing protein [Gilvibacter sp.]